MSFTLNTVKSNFVDVEFNDYLFIAIWSNWFDESLTNFVRWHLYVAIKNWAEAPIIYNVSMHVLQSKTSCNLIGFISQG